MPGWRYAAREEGMDVGWRCPHFRETHEEAKTKRGELVADSLLRISRLLLNHFTRCDVAP